MIPNVDRLIGCDEEAYRLFDGSMELFSLKHDAAFNIRGARAEIKRKGIAD